MSPGQRQDAFYPSEEQFEVLLLVLRVNDAPPETGARPAFGLRSVKKIVADLIGSPERKIDAAPPTHSL